MNAAGGNPGFVLEAGTTLGQDKYNFHISTEEDEFYQLYILA